MQDQKMSLMVTFSGMSIKIKRIDENNFEATAPLFLRPYIEQLPVGQEIKLSLGSIKEGLKDLLK